MPGGVKLYPQGLPLTPVWAGGRVGAGRGADVGVGVGRGVGVDDGACVTVKVGLGVSVGLGVNVLVGVGVLVAKKLGMPELPEQERTLKVRRAMKIPNMRIVLMCFMMPL